MNGEKSDLDTTVLADEKVTAKSAAPKKKKKVTPPVATLASSSVAIKAKPEKTEQTIAKPKVTKTPKVEASKAPKEAKLKAPKEDKLKTPKDDKLTKFMVTIKKSVRKSIKKEAADVGVSMNEYIVLAVVEKLKKNSLDATK